jgi:hypothetical protein
VRLAAAADELSHTGVEVRLLGSAGVPGDESFLALFAAREEDAVARAIARAEIAADRIVPVLWQADHAH